jgi:hypothetical protein
MTYDKKALQELRDKVEAGDIEAAPFWKVWLPENEDGMLAYDARDAAKGSLDAAISLLEAVLPGWDYRIHRVDGDCFALVHKQGYLDDYIFDVVIYPLIMSRALLLAILDALISEGR